MLTGILPFLIQWLALSHLGSHFLNQQSYQASSFYSYPPKSQWTLLNDFANLCEDEIEKFLPQVCNILIDRETTNDDALLNQYENILLNKCSNCLPFGMKACNLLKAGSQVPSEGLLRNLFPSNSNVMQDRQDRLRKFLIKCEAATSYGFNLSQQDSQHRCEYFKDMTFMMDSLARLGTELKGFPHSDRNNHLRVAISQLNNLLFRRMIRKCTDNNVGPTTHFQSQDHMSFSTESFYNSDSQKSFQYEPYRPYPNSNQYPQDHQSTMYGQQNLQQFQSTNVYSNMQEGQRYQGEYYGSSNDRVVSNNFIPTSSLVSQSLPVQHLYSGFDVNVITPNQILHLLPQAAGYSLHFPLQHCLDNIHKILRFVESECEVMPSRDRVPYHVIVELLEQSYPCRSVELFAPTSGLNMSPKQILPHDLTRIENHIDGNVDKLSTSISNDEDEENNTIIDLEKPSISPSDSLATSKECENVSRVGVDTDSSPGNQNNLENGNSFTKVVDGIRGGNVPYYPQQHSPVLPQGNNFPSNELLHNYQSDPAHPNPSEYNQQFNHYQLPQQRITFSRSQTWAEKKDMLKQQSPFGHLPGWTIKSFLVKSGDDLRKEMLAMQLIEYVQNVFRMEGIGVHLRPYQIMSTGYQAGLVEFINGAKSIDRIKKSASKIPSSLKDYFDFTFGPSYSLFHATAVENFVKSLAGYSLVTYILQVKDRHNANLLIDPEGNIIHIDYGFILGDSPGFNINFESAPFKLTKEYIDVMGGIDSYGFKMFEDLFVRGFFALQKHIDGIIAIIQLFYGDQKKGCVESLKSRLLFANTQADVISLIRDSLESWRTKQYDMFQLKSNNILM